MADSPSTGRPVPPTGRSNGASRSGGRGEGDGRCDGGDGAGGFDVIVVGAGAAGLYSALCLPAQ